MRTLSSYRECIVNLAAIHVGARQMHACLEAVDSLCYGSKLRGLFERGSSSAPGAGDERRRQGLHSPDAVKQVGQTLSGEVFDPTAEPSIHQFSTPSHRSRYKNRRHRRVFLLLFVGVRERRGKRRREGTEVNIV